MGDLAYIAGQEIRLLDIPADNAGGQVNRVALRFALIAVAGEIATVWGVLAKNDAYS